MYTLHYILTNDACGERTRASVPELIQLLNARPDGVGVEHAVIVDEVGARRWTPEQGMIKDDGKPRNDEDGLRDGNQNCDRCAGTGRYITGSENGRPKFGEGACFRCEGKGYTTQADRKRNYGYNFYRRIS